MLGKLYQTGGYGWKRDFSLALTFYGRAAQRGELTSLLELGYMHRRGEGTPVDLEKSSALFRRAAATGHPEGLKAWGQSLLRGIGVSPDEREGLRLVREAAMRRSDGAQFLLGGFHFRGEFCDKDWAESYAWMKLATDNGHPDTAKFLEVMLANMDPSVIEEGERRYKDWKARIEKTSSQEERVE